MKQKQNFQWNKMTMGVCYYPEHWDKALWEADLTRMLDIGITVFELQSLRGINLNRRKGALRLHFLMIF